MNIKYAGLLVALMVSPALADNAPAKPKAVCDTIEKAKKLFPDKTTFTFITPGQLNFVRGIYVRDPDTPNMIPPGNKAMMAVTPGGKGGVILFIDGKNACSPYPLAPEGVDFMMQISTGAVDEHGDEY